MVGDVVARRLRAGPATDSNGNNGGVCHGGVGVTFRDSAVPEKVTFRGNVRKPWEMAIP